MTVRVLFSSIARRTISTVPPAGAVASKVWVTPAASSSARAVLIHSAACPLCAVGLANRTAGRSPIQRSIPATIGTLAPRSNAAHPFARDSAAVERAMIGSTLPARLYDPSEEHALLRQTV